MHTLGFVLRWEEGEELHLDAAAARDTRAANYMARERGAPRTYHL